MSIFIKDFLDDNGKIRPDLLDDEALEIADKLSGKLTTHQVRKFFDEIKSYKMKVESGHNFQEILPLIVMLKSKAKYAFNKERTAKKKEGLKLLDEFICQSVEKIKESKVEEQRDNFLAFCLFFEAVYGFANLSNN